MYSKSKSMLTTMLGALAMSDALGSATVIRDPVPTGRHQCAKPKGHGKLREKRKQERQARKRGRKK